MSDPSRPTPATGRTRRQSVDLLDGRKAAFLIGGKAGVCIDPQMPPMVLLHGLGGDAMTWQFNLTALATDRLVVAPDLPGHGFSSLAVGGGHVDDLADWLVLLLDRWGFARVDLIGHSLGARVALSLAHRYPDRAHRLTLIACAGLGSDLDQGFLDDLAMAGNLDLARRAATALFAAPSTLVEPLARALALRLSVADHQHAIRTILDANRADLSQRLVMRDWVPTAPAQLVWGAVDKIVPPPDRHLVPSKVDFHLLDGAGHMPHVEASSRVNALIRSFH